MNICQTIEKITQYGCMRHKENILQSCQICSTQQAKLSNFIHQKKNVFIKIFTEIWVPKFWNL